jgi:hypothetical protein
VPLGPQWRVRCCLPLGWRSSFRGEGKGCGGCSMATCAWCPVLGHPTLPRNTVIAAHDCTVLGSLAPLGRAARTSRQRTMGVLPESLPLESGLDGGMICASRRWDGAHGGGGGVWLGSTTPCDVAWRPPGPHSRARRCFHRTAVQRMQRCSAWSATHGTVVLFRPALRALRTHAVGRRPTATDCHRLPPTATFVCDKRLTARLCFC